MIQQKTETLALAPFKAIVADRELECVTGQGGANRLAIDGAVYYQFGDLRVELPEHTLVVEVESAGGVTNLAKYWEAVARARVAKPVKLLHVFLQKSANDYASHIVVWQFLNARMGEALGGRWEARHCVARGTSVQDLAGALAIFSAWLPRRVAD